MTKEVVTPEPATEPVATPDPTEPVRLPDDHPLVKAFTAQKAENTALKQAKTDAENATKTEAEKTAERIAALEKTNADFALEKLRTKVAADKSDTETGLAVPADLLTGSTEAELIASADRLIPHLAKGTQGAQLPGNSRAAGPVSQVHNPNETREDRVKRLNAELKR